MLRVRYQARGSVLSLRVMQQYFLDWGLHQPRAFWLRWVEGYLVQEPLWEADCQRLDCRVSLRV